RAEEANRNALSPYQALANEFPLSAEIRRRLADVHNELAWVLCTRPEWNQHGAAESLKHTLKATELDPENHDRWHNLGVAHCRLGHWKEALEFIAKSRRLEKSTSPPSAFDRFFEAMAYEGLGDHINARRCYDEGVAWLEKHDPKHPDLRRFKSEAEK